MRPFLKFYCKAESTYTGSHLFVKLGADKEMGHGLTQVKDRMKSLRKDFPLSMV